MIEGYFFCFRVLGVRNIVVLVDCLIRLYLKKYLIFVIIIVRNIFDGIFFFNFLGGK